MKILIIFNQEPYNNTDITWNGLRLAKTLKNNGQEVLLNERFSRHGKRRL